MNDPTTTPSMKLGNALPAVAAVQSRNPVSLPAKACGVRRKRKAPREGLSRDWDNLFSVLVGADALLLPGPGRPSTIRWEKG
jgi:hypothetical protein